jgi:hypothetical protein
VVSLGSIASIEGRACHRAIIVGKASIIDIQALAYYPTHAHLFTFHLFIDIHDHHLFLFNYILHGANCTEDTVLIHLRHHNMHLSFVGRTEEQDSDPYWCLVL